jgi:hypothetical protein
MKKPTPKVAVVSKSEAYWLSLGKNNRAMITVKKPKTMSSGDDVMSRAVKKRGVLIDWRVGRRSVCKALSARSPSI